MRNIPLVFVLPLLFAASASTGCGRELSESLDGGSQHPGDDDDDGGTVDGGCSTTSPPIDCETPCGGGAVEAQCVDGAWQCPEFNGIACPAPDDGGVDACSESVGACAGVTPCTGMYETPVCENGIWSCEWTGVCEDGGEPDAPTPIDDAGESFFACGDQACDPSVSYCQITTGGPVNPDGGSSSGYWCEPLPTSCAPGAATCACLQAFGDVTSWCSCIGQDGDVIVTCDVP